MAFHYQLDPVQHLVICTIRGVMTNTDVTNYHRTLSGDARFHPSMDQLLNCIEVTRVRVSAETLHRLAELCPFGPGSRRAIVVPPGDAFGYTKLIQGLARNRISEIEAFSDIPAALRFLGRDRLTVVDKRRPKILPSQRAMFRRISFEPELQPLG